MKILRQTKPYRSILMIPFFILLTLPVACSDEEETSSTSGGAADTSGEAMDTSDPAEPLVEPPVVYMYVSTAAGQNGDFGGIDAANDICLNNRPPDASFDSDVDTYKAVLATDDFHPRDIVDNNPPIQRPDRTVIDNFYANFFNRNHTLIRPVVASNTLVWTGLDASGDISSNNCEDWTSASTVQGEYGGAHVRDQLRFRSGAAPCNNTTPTLLCIAYDSD